MSGDAGTGNPADSPQLERGSCFVDAEVYAFNGKPQAIVVYFGNACGLPLNEVRQRVSRHYVSPGIGSPW